MDEFAKGRSLEAAAEVAEAMGLHPFEISSDPEKLAKFHDVLDYFGQFENKRSYIASLTKRVPKQDAIGHLWKYVGLRKEFDSSKKKVAELGSLLEDYER